MQSHEQSRYLIQLGLVLLLFGLPVMLVFLGRMDTTREVVNELDACVNGAFLISLALIWPRLKLPDSVRNVLFRATFYGSLIKWVAELLLLCWFAGAYLSPPERNPLHLLAQDTLLKLSWSFLLIAVIAGGLLTACGSYKTRIGQKGTHGERRLIKFWRRQSNPETPTGR